jgi:serpin B
MREGADFALLRVSDQHLGFRALRLPYRGPEISMLLLLPDEHAGLQDLETRLDAQFCAKLLARFEKSTPRLVHLSLPRFKCDCRIELAEPLSQLGIRRAFSEQADFGGLFGVPNAVGLANIDQALHRSTIAVNEKGTEAAASTMLSVTLGIGSSFKADHPFLFLIVDEPAGVILFVGRVMDPRQTR